MKVFIATLGCKVNEVDSELYAQELAALGVETTRALTEADAVIVNSCSVTSKAQAQSLQLVRRARRERPDARVYLVGCGAALLKLMGTEAPEGVTVVGMQERGEVARLVSGCDAKDAGLWREQTLRSASVRNRVDVRVQEGCDNMCTYCIVPLLRGTRLASKEATTVTEEILGLARAGVKEVILTGTELGKYGEAPDQLAPLLDCVLTSLEEAGLPTRVRLSSLNPDAVSELLVSQFVRHSSLCRQLHLPMQSGSDRILGRMRRPYTASGFMESVDRLRSVDALFSFTTDVIAGFPGETDEDFDETLDMVRAVGFAKVHVFPYSPRPFTAAAREDDSVSPRVKAERVHTMLRTAELTGLAFGGHFVGRTVRIVTEDVRPGTARGYTDAYLWTDASVAGGRLIERDRFLQVQVNGCHFEGDRVVLTGEAVE